MTSIQIGPCQIEIAAEDMEIPGVLGAHRETQPARWRYRLACEIRQGAGHDGRVRVREGSIEGPGFRLRALGADAYRAELASGGALSGALSALLIDRSQREPVMLMHAATLRFSGVAVLVLGKSGTGKSTLAQRHASRALGSNAALVWCAEGGALRVSPLPLTGKDDGKVVAGAWPIFGALVLGERRGPVRSAAERLALLLAHTASALGMAPNMGVALQMAETIAVRERRRWGAATMSAR